MFILLQCPITRAVTALQDTFGVTNDVIEDEQISTGVKPFSQVPGPKGLPVVGTLFDYFKKDGLRFNKMFEVRQAIRAQIIDLLIITVKRHLYFQTTHVTE